METVPSRHPAIQRSEEYDLGSRVEGEMLLKIRLSLSLSKQSTEGKEDMHSTELLLCHPNGPFQLNTHRLSFLASPTGTQIKRRVDKGP